MQRVFNNTPGRHPYSAIYSSVAYAAPMLLLTLTLLHSPYMESDENIVNTSTQSQKVMDMEQFPL